MSALAQLNTLGRDLSAASDIDQVLQSSIRGLQALFPSAQGYLLLKTDVSLRPELFHPFGSPLPPSPDLEELQATPGLLGQVLADGIARFTPVAADTLLSSWEQQWLSADERMIACFPLTAGGTIYGAIEMVYQPIEEDLETIPQQLEAGALLIALAVARLTPSATSPGYPSRYHRLFQQAKEALVLVNPATLLIEEVNSATASLSGYSEEELTAFSIDQLMAFGLPNWQETKLDVFFTADQVDFDGLIRTSDGQAIQVTAVVSEIVLEQERYLLLMLRDARERHRAVRQLLQAERLACMGRMVETIAHEINNPLQAISNSLHLLLNRPIPEDRRERYLNLTQREVERLTGIVQQILDFHRPYRDGMRPVSVHAVLEQVLVAFTPSLEQSGIALEREWAERLPWVMGITSHLRYVFQNLVTNAIDAMPSGGKLTVRTSVQPLPQGGTAQAVVIEVIDTGPGVSDMDVQLIFEPFYTTKSNSTGMGLPISYNIVRQHGGTLSVSNDGGAIFRVALPSAGTSGPLE